MILEVLRDQPARIDGVDKFYDLRVNIAGRNQLRLKVVAITEKGEIPIDIVIYQYSMPMLVKTSIAISFDGKDMIHNLPFEGKLAFDFFKKKWKLKGHLGSKNFDDEFLHAAEIISVIAGVYSRGVK